jgi:hypothetical protein
MKKEDSNKLIAEFLGYVSKEAPANKEYHHNLASISTTWRDRVIMENPDNFTDYFDLSLAEYHKSWDWLMPVVEKIEGMGYEFGITTDCSYIHENESTGWLYHSNDNGSKIENTYNCVLQFIQWYNKNH